MGSEKQSDGKSPPESAFIADGLYGALVRSAKLSNLKQQSSSLLRKGHVAFGRDEQGRCCLSVFFLFK